MSKEMTHMTKKSLAEQFKISVTTLKVILKNKDATKAAIKNVEFIPRNGVKYTVVNLINWQKL